MNTWDLYMKKSGSVSFYYSFHSKEDAKTSAKELIAKGLCIGCYLLSGKNKRLYIS